MEIFIEKSALSYFLSQEVLKKEHPLRVISSYDDFEWPYISFPELITLGKKKLFLLKHQGRFFKPCPGTKNYLCCGYQIFHFGEGCPLDCSYCILQVYLNRPGLKVWANLVEDGFQELERILERAKIEKKVLRIGTGEFADSLALESIVGVAEKLIHFWEEKKPLAVLELKTKVCPSEKFFAKFKSNPKIIFAWSVNTEKIIKEEEKTTASLKARLKSAKKAVEKGFSCAFHFDPIIYYEGAEEEYPQVLEEILNNFPLEKIAWISFGTFRYPKGLKEIAEKRFPQSKIYSQEFIDGLDGKKRYFVEIRKKLYRSFQKLIKETKDQVTFYFCMESERIWEEVLGEREYNSTKLIERLNKVALSLCKSAE